VLTFKCKWRLGFRGDNQHVVVAGVSAALFNAGNGYHNKSYSCPKVDVFEWGGWLVLGCAHNPNKMRWVGRVLTDCLLPVSDVTVVLNTKRLQRVGPSVGPKDVGGNDDAYVHCCTGSGESSI
jgi:hypothetical protein